MKTIFTISIIPILLVLVLSVNAIYGQDIDQEKNAGATFDIPTSEAFFETSLANSITSSQTTMSLVSGIDKDGNTLASSTYAFVIDEGTSVEEMVVADCTNTTCTNMTRGLSVLTGTSTVSSLQNPHRRGASVKITNAPQLLILSRIINGIGDFPNIIRYKSGTNCASGDDGQSICDKTYIDNLTNQGAATSSETIAGIIEQATQVEMASSTQFDSDNPHAINSENATSTPDGTSQAGLFAVISENDGKLNQLWYDLTELFSFSGGLTSTATTTLDGSNVNNNALVINTVAYSFPSAQGVASTTLQNDGSGNLSWLGYSKLLTVLPSATLNCSTNDAASTTVYSINIPANTLGTTNGVRVRTNMLGGNYSGGNVIWFDVSYGTASTTSNVTVVAGQFGVGGFIEVNLFADGATNSQFINLSVDGADAGTGSGASLSQDSTGDLLLTLVTRSITSGPLTCGNIVAEIIQ